VKHLKASPIGAEVVVKARLEKVDGIKLQFHLEAFQGEKLIAEGSHLRFIVNRQEFMSRVLKAE
jgi:hypothetical protein